ncbi:hypothetical protein ACFPYN_03160 [Paenisporosarcina macmurdoensis]|uniref:DUF5132 domain-containing protein n=1 Tax=Paenisporosarcina macmurdoensis TaxID=212659 RepID=A0ABW1L5M3_9BACL
MNVKPIIVAALPVVKKIGKVVIVAAAEKTFEDIKDRLDEKRMKKNKK